jgi:CagE, TrbE, VirB family, component of type IV transporter system
MKYAELLPYDWFTGPLIGLADGRIKFVYRVLKGFSNETFSAEQLHEKALNLAAFLNETMSEEEPLQVLALVVPDVDEQLESHLALIKTERPILLEIVKERCRTFRELARRGRCVSLQVYIVGGYDPHKRTRLPTGQEQMNPAYLLRKQALNAPSTQIDSTATISTALERLSQQRSALESYGLELEVLTETQNRKLIQTAQFSGSQDTSSDELAIGRYTFYKDYLVQQVGEAVTYYACLVRQQTPKATQPGMFVNLMARAEFARVSLVAYRPPTESTAIVINTKKNLNDLGNAFSDMLGKNQSTANSIQSQELRTVERKIFQEKQQVMRSGWIIVVSGTSLKELNLRVKTVSDLLGKAKINITVGSFAQEDLWFASLPASPHPLPSLTSFSCFPINAAHLLMPVIPWQGSARPYFLFMNRWRQLVPFDPFGLDSSNQLFSGKTRTGKSVQACLEALMAAAVGWRTAIIDKMGSYHFAMEHVIGGVARTMEPGTFTLNPFEFIVLPGTDLRTQQVPPERISTLKAFFASVLCKPGEPLDPAMRSVLTVALDRTYARVLPEGRFPIISDLLETLRSLKRGDDIPEDEVELLSESSKHAMETLSTVLIEFRSPTSMESQIFNAQSSEKFFDGDYLYFDVAPLDKSERVQGLVSQLLAASLDEWVKASPGRRTFLIFDEIWRYLLKNKDMADLMVDAARTYQRYGVALVLVTQSFNDVLSESEYATSLFEQTIIRFALRQDGFEKALPSFDLYAPEVVKRMVSDLKKQKGFFSEMVLMYDKETSLLVNYSSPLLYWATTSDLSLDVPLRNFFIQELGFTAEEALVKVATLYPHGVPDEATLERAKAGEFLAAS